MPATPADLFARLEALGIETSTVEHPPLFTVEESRRLRGEIPGQHTKNLFLVDRKGATFLVVAREDADIDLKRLHLRLGCGRLSFGKPELLEEVLGIRPGAVTPFALVNDSQGRVSVVLDEAMMREPLLNYHPLVNTATTAIPAEGLVKDATTQSFRADVLDESRRQPVLVDFWAPWCGPCKQLGPVLEKAVKAAKGKVKLVKLNTDEHQAIAGQIMGSLGIQSIPAVIAFKNGQPVDGFIGALPESQVKAFVERVVGPIGPSDAEAILAEAETAPARCSAACPRARRTTRPWRRRAPSSTSPARRRTSATRASSRPASTPMPTTTRRASTSRSRSTPGATGRARSTIFWRSSAATGTGTRTRRA